MRFYFLNTLLLPLLLVQAANAQVFKYQDKTGVTHYVDSVEKVPAKYKSQLNSQSELPSISRVNTGERRLYEDQPARPAYSRKNVEIFVTSWCPHCNNLEEYLLKEKIVFTKYDIEKSNKGKKLYQKIAKGSGVPVTRIGGEIISGFKPNVIKAALSRSVR